MNISVHINEHFQIINGDANATIFEEVSSHITRIIGGLSHQSLTSAKEESLKRLLAKTSEQFTFLTIATKIISAPSMDNKTILVTIRQEESANEKGISLILKEKAHLKPLRPNTEQDLWNFLAEAEVVGMEEIETGQQGQKVNERMESLLREAEKQGLEWIKTMNDLTISLIKLKESKQKMKAVLEAVPDAMFQVDSEGTYLEYILAKNEDAIPSAAFIGNNLKDILPEEYAQEAIKELQLSLKTSTVRAYSFEWELEDNLKYFEMRFSPINESEVLCMIRDITEEKRGEEMLRKSKMYYQDLIKRSPAPILVLDRESKFIDANPAALDLLGVEHFNQLKNRRGYDFIHKRDKSIVKDKFKRGFIENIPEGVARFSAVKYNGEEMQIEVAGAIMNYGGRRVAQIVLREVK